MNTSVMKVTENLTTPDSSPTSTAKVKESEKKLFTMGSSIVKSVIKFSSAYNHNIRNIQKIQASTSKSRHLPSMKKSYENYKEGFNVQEIPDGFFTSDKREVHIAVEKLLKEGFLEK